MFLFTRRPRFPGRGGQTREQLRQRQREAGQHLASVEGLGFVQNSGVAIIDSLSPIVFSTSVPSTSS
jgi:hypothetical protein